MLCVVGGKLLLVGTAISAYLVADYPVQYPTRFSRPRLRIQWRASATASCSGATHAATVGGGRIKQPDRCVWMTLCAEQGRQACEMDGWMDGWERAAIRKQASPAHLGCVCTASASAYVGTAGKRQWPGLGSCAVLAVLSQASWSVTWHMAWHGMAWQDAIVSIINPYPTEAFRRQPWLLGLVTATAARCTDRGTEGSPGRKRALPGLYQRLRRDYRDACDALDQLLVRKSDWRRRVSGSGVGLGAFLSCPRVACRAAPPAASDATCRPWRASLARSAVESRG